ncbi:MAG: hypothetical protein EG822_16780 [Deltaproteobacteria bacterium]|nr:hypothetical protein [Deltaproteobacteria bacterium]TLN01416.1 MAG: hypothetical protein FDZ73_15925 [bacterium]
MKYIVTKMFSAKINGGQSTFLPGDRVEFPEAKAAKLLRADVILSADPEIMEKEYIQLLARFWSLDDTPPGISDKDADHVLARLDILFRELTRQGRKVPVRLPVERNRHEPNQKEVAL